MSTLVKIIIGGIIFFISIFVPHSLIYYILMFVSYMVLSFEVIINVFKKFGNSSLFDENLLMLIATVGAIAIGEYEEAVAVMLFYQIGEFIGDKAIDNSKSSITKLLDLKSDTSNIKTDNGIEIVDSDNVKTGDIIVVKPGERIPLDGVVIYGESQLDTKALTGESIPRLVKKNETVLSGCINLNSVLEIKVTSEYNKSTVSRILERLENVNENKARKEKFITRFSKIYTPIVVISAIIMCIVPTLLFNQDFIIWLKRSLVFLVISCPCALVLSIPLGYFCGMGVASKRGLLFKSASELEELDKINFVAFDKTGTLTKGNFKVTKIMPLYATRDAVLKYASYCEYYSNHPIATAIKKEYKKVIDENKISDYEEIHGKGIKANIDGFAVIIGNKTLFDELNIKTPLLNELSTIVLVSVNNDYIGSIVIEDKIRQESLSLKNKLEEVGIKNTIILSGDNEYIVKNVAKKLNMDYQSNLLPEDKVDKIEELKKDNKVLFVGDGINDAIVLSSSDIGVSLGNIGSDVAIEASDIVIMNDNLLKIVEGIKIARTTNKIVLFNIIFAIATKLLILLLGIFGLTNMWLAVFADVGVTIITILNSLRIFRIRL